MLLRVTFVMAFICSMFEIHAQQGKPVYDKVRQLSTTQKSLLKYTPFTYCGEDIRGTSLCINMSSLTKRQLKSASLIDLDIPLNATSSITVSVYPNTLFVQNKMTRVTQEHYIGIIKNDPNSLVSLNINTDYITGIISNANGNLVIQPDEQQSNSVILFNEGSRQSVNKWECHYDLINEIIPPDKSENKSKIIKSASTDTITIYIEGDHALYQLNDSSEVKTMNYISGVMNQVSALYANEMITILVDSIKIWKDTSDTYAYSNARNAIFSFEDHLNDQFDADFAHLISGRNRSNGGIAHVNAICDKSRAYSYSNVDGYYADTLSYSWDVHVIAHELGHNLGSYHTHDCVWGPNGDQAIDGCYANTCGGSIPTPGGTIMSYCHLQDTIIFALGFGQEPGDLMRSNIFKCRDLTGFICSKALLLSNSDTLQAAGPYKGDGATNSNGRNANWYSFTPVEDGLITISSCSPYGKDTRLFLYSGSCSNLTFINMSDDACTSGGGFYYASVLSSIPVIANVAYYIEWDGRWSSDPFDFIFTYESNSIIESCQNGIMDGDEIGIDCGGSYCSACEECNSGLPGSQGLIQDATYRSNSEITINDTVNLNGSLVLSSSMGIVLEIGFEVMSGAKLEAIIEDCATYLQRLQNLVNQN